MKKENNNGRSVWMQILIWVVIGVMAVSIVSGLIYAIAIS